MGTAFTEPIPLFCSRGGILRIFGGFILGFFLLLHSFKEKKLLKFHFTKLYKRTPISLSALNTLFCFLTFFLKFYLILQLSLFFFQNSLGNQSKARIIFISVFFFLLLILLHLLFLFLIIYCLIFVSR